MHHFKKLGSLLAVGLVSCSVSLFAQEEQENRGGREGGRREFGGRGGGEFGGRGGGRGEGGPRGGRGDSGGGQPWQGRGEGGAPMGGMERGGFGGGFGGGGFGSGRGGFDPAMMLSRMDGNGNGMIDVDEMQGPARFMLERMARDNPKIDLSRPIPISVITESLGGEAAGGEADEMTKNEDKPLVPGFDDYQLPPPPPGFGKEGETSSIKIEDSDLREAEERMRRYDRNSDNSLDEEELRNGRWSENPMQYDRNGDKKIQVNELAVRYARRRVNEAQPNASAPGQSNRGNGWTRWNNGQAEAAMAQAENPNADPWKNRASYRIDDKSSNSNSNIQGIPNWFNAADSDGDGLVAMHEFTSEWDENQVYEFQTFDINGDGFISTNECLVAVRKGLIRGSVPYQRPASESATAKTAASSAKAGPGAVFSKEGLPEDAAERWVSFCTTRLQKMDADRNAIVTINEWSASEGEFNKVDMNGDGAISLAEYYAHKVNKR